MTAALVRAVPVVPVSDIDVAMRLWTGTLGFTVAFDADGNRVTFFVPTGA